MSVKFVFKTVVIGDGAVGKTCLTLTFVKKEFKTDYIPTLGVDIYTKNFNFDDTNITMLIWDIAGQERFKIMRKQYYQGTQGGLIVFDLTRPETFYNVTSWYEELVKYTNKKVPIVLLGNKADLADQVKVSEDKCIAMAKKLGAEYYPTSAKTGLNVEKAFFKLLREIVKNAYLKNAT
ncbi:MAG: GTP-binding protein [Candidatus Odinarchaeia archaeon]